MKLQPQTDAKLKRVLKHDDLDVVREVLAELRQWQLESLAGCPSPDLLLREQGKAQALDTLLNRIFKLPNQ